MFYKVGIPLVLDSQVLVHLRAKALACPVRCDSCKTGIVCAVKAIQEISESFKHSDGKRRGDTGYGRLH